MSWVGFLPHQVPAHRGNRDMVHLSSALMSLSFFQLRVSLGMVSGINYIFLAGMRTVAVLIKHW